jgi:hypothetical protein
MTTLARAQALLDEAVAAAPENPRVLWILGGQQLWTPPQYGGNRAKAMETYERALAACREAPGAPHPLAPLELAEQQARAALELQPEWK